MVQEPYRGRFAPSPTGPIHLGTARTALVAWWRARQCGGRFILRMEDLDRPRERPGAAAAILNDLRWLGIDWDEGPDVGGPHAPYTQSEREPRYARAIEALRRVGLVYPCTCTRREIQSVASAPHGTSPRYPGTCREGPTHPERPAAQRFRMLSEQEGDFIVRRRDGLFAYHLAMVVDDIDMEITEIVRGDDLEECVPLQSVLFRSLLADPPGFLHVPLVLGDDGRRLAKRHGAISIAELRAQGWAPEAIVGRLAWSCGLTEEVEVAPASAFVGVFDPARIPNQAVRLDQLL